MRHFLLKHTTILTLTACLLAIILYAILAPPDSSVGTIRRVLFG